MVLPRSGSYHHYPFLNEAILYAHHPLKGPGGWALGLDCRVQTPAPPLTGGVTLGKLFLAFRSNSLSKGCIPCVQMKAATDLSENRRLLLCSLPKQ